MKVLKPSLLLVVAFGAGFAWASDGAHGGEPHGIPWMSIAAQCFNLGILLAALIFALRKTATKYFAERRSVYTDLVSRADRAREEAERNRAQIAARLNDLEKTSRQSLDQVAAEAYELKERLITEAKALALKMKAEAERAVQVEVEKARHQLRDEMLNLSVEAARQALKEQIGGPEQKKLQKEFVDKIQVVQ